MKEQKKHPSKESGYKEFYSAKNCHLDLQVKDIDTVGRTVCFIGNTMNFFDDGWDILMPGCSKTSIENNGPSSSAPDKIQHAMFHDLSRIPGKLKLLEERVIDGSPVIYAESKLSTSTEGNDALINYVNEIYNQHSIGFQNLQYEFVSDEAHGNSREADMWKKVKDECINAEELESAGICRYIKEIKLFEISTVSFGMNKLTPTIGIKSENRDAVMLSYISRIDKLHQQLKTGTQSDGMMRTIEVQVLQLKQALQEIFMQFGIEELSNKKKKPDPNETGFDYNKLISAMG